MSRTTRTLFALLAATAVAAPVLAASAEQPARDDRSLLRAEAAPPHVLLVLDSAGSMSFDGVLNQLNFPASADHSMFHESDGVTPDLDTAYWLADYYLSSSNHLGTAIDFSRITDDGSTPTRDEIAAYLAGGAKLPQAKEAVQYLIDAYPSFNYGFTYFDKNGMRVYHLNYLYEVENDLLDGTTAGYPMRLGPENANHKDAPIFDIRFGADGSEVYYYYDQNADGTWSPGSEPNNPENGQLRMVQYLSDQDGNSLAVSGVSDGVTAADRAGDGLYFYPAYDWSQVTDSDIRGGLLGSQSWDTIAGSRWSDIQAATGVTGSAYDLDDERHRLAVRDWALSIIEPTQFATGTLYVTERIERWQNDNKAWNYGPNEVAASRTTPLTYKTHFVAYDSREFDEGQEGEFDNNSWSGADIDNGGACGNKSGYMDQETFGGSGGEDVPIVPLSQPDTSTGVVTDQRPLIEEYLVPQTTPIFHFPTRSTDRFLPAALTSWLPFTEAPIAFDRRPLKEMLMDATGYFETVNGWADPEKSCRQNFLILISDGEETCTQGGANTVEVNAGKLHDEDVTIFTVYFGEPTDPNNDIKSVAEAGGGEYYEAKSGLELIEKLNLIGQEIEERTRGFAAPVIPSVEQTSRQAAYIATFTPLQDRSIFRGHIRSYPIDEETGTLQGLNSDGVPSPSNALWDVGDLLAKRDYPTSATDPRRVFYYDGQSDQRRELLWGGTDVATGSNLTIPTGTDTVDGEIRAWLAGEIFDDETWTPNLSDDEQKLEAVVNFVRGVPMDADNGVPGRDTDAYAWCGQTADQGYDPSYQHPCEADSATLQGIEKLGDIFHARPQLMGRPACYSCWFYNLNDYGSAATGTSFLDDHQYRRQVLFASANDGALHAFEAGVWDSGDQRYDRGSGRELFAWVPQGVMGTLDEIAGSADPLLGGSTEHWWSVDGTPTVADVWIDPDAATSGVVQSSDREWRSVVLWGLRRGGRSVTALDVTEPDTTTVNGDFQEDSGVTDSTSRDATNPDWPAFLWEFTDTSDEDSNGEADLGHTWSRPLVGFVEVEDGGLVEDRAVAFFGGGYERSAYLGTKSPTGNWVYGVDIETGEILVKVQSDGMVPGEIRALDVDSNGFLERLYWADTSGDINRMELPQPITLVGGRASGLTKETIFTAGSDQPFFLSPTLVPIAAQSGSAEWAILVGSGNRDDVFVSAATPNRFYAVVDRVGGVDTEGNAITTLTEGDLIQIAADDPVTTQNYLYEAEGWYLVLENGASGTAYFEKANTPATVLDYEVIFSTFAPTPQTTTTVDTDGDGVDDAELCQRSGNARTYVVDLYNANPAVTETFTDADGNTIESESRYVQHGEDTAMGTSPAVYVGADGRVHVLQALDNLRVVEPVEAFDVPVSVFSWKED